MFKRDVPGKERLQINGLIEEVLVLFRGEFRRKRVLQTEFAREDPAVLANRVQLQQVLMNLITNAVDAMHGPSHRPRVLQTRTETGRAIMY